MDALIRAQNKSCGDEVLAREGVRSTLLFYHRESGKE